MKRRRKRKCLHCKELFRPDKYNSWHQEYCLKEECQKARKKRGQENWLKKAENKDYFKGEENVRRVKQWRKEHPEYWKREKKQIPLQDVGFSQQAGIQEDTKINKPMVNFALQDLANSQLFLIVGLISHLTGEPLQDSVAHQIRKFIFKGKSILTLKQEGGFDEKEVTSFRSAKESSGPIQLGGSKADQG